MLHSTIISNLFRDWRSQKKKVLRDLQSIHMTRDESYELEQQVQAIRYEVKWGGLKRYEAYRTVSARKSNHEPLISDRDLDRMIAERMGVRTEAAEPDSEDDQNEFMFDRSKRRSNRNQEDEDGAEEGEVIAGPTSFRHGRRPGKIAGR